MVQWTIASDERPELGRGAMTMQKFAALLLTMSWLINTAYAEPLPPGKPAGVDKAQVWNLETLAVITGGAALIVGFSFVLSGSTNVVTPIAGANGNSILLTPTTTQ